MIWRTRSCRLPLSVRMVSASDRDSGSAADPSEPSYPRRIGWDNTGRVRVARPPFDMRNEKGGRSIERPEGTGKVPTCILRRSSSCRCELVHKAASARDRCLCTAWPLRCRRPAAAALPSVGEGRAIKRWSGAHPASMAERPSAQLSPETRAGPGVLRAASDATHPGGLKDPETAPGRVSGL